MRTFRSRWCFIGLGEVKEDEDFLCLFFLAISFAVALVLFLFFRSTATIKNLELPKRVHMRTPDVSRKNRGKCLSGVASPKKFAHGTVTKCLRWHKKSHFNLAIFIHRFIPAATLQTNRSTRKLTQIKRKAFQDPRPSSSEITSASA